MEKKLLSPAEVWEVCKKNCKPMWVTAFWVAVIVGLLTHMPVLVRDIPTMTAWTVCTLTRI